MERSSEPAHTTDSFSHMGLRDFAVFEGVLSPEKSMITPLMAEYLFKNHGLFKNADVLDLGCGSGIFAVMMARCGARKVVAIDILDECVDNTKENVSKYGIKNKIDVRRGDMFEPLKNSERFDLIVFNPPFFHGKPIKNKPISYAFLSDNIINRLMEESPAYLKDNGMIITAFSDIAGTENDPKISVRKHGFSVKIVAKSKADYGINMVYEIRPKKTTTGFSEKVWEITKKVPKGKVTTYNEIAKALGSPDAGRAVGQALKRNPMPAIKKLGLNQSAHAKNPFMIPCHRVVRSDGSLGGYYGSKSTNINKKKELLKKEGITMKNNKIDLDKFIHKF